MPAPTHTSLVPKIPGARCLIVEARFYVSINEGLLNGATKVLEQAGAEITVTTVPGALELPLAAAILLDGAQKRGQPFDALIALGCVIRGETGHYDIVAGESARALLDLAMVRRLPFGNGILTVETEQQARIRAFDLDKGGAAALAALQLLALKRNAS